METVRRGDFFKKGKKIFKVLRKLDPETGTIQEQFINGGVGEVIENVIVKNYKSIMFPFTILYPEKAKKLQGEKIEDHGYSVIDDMDIDENFITSIRKKISKEFKVDIVDITFSIDSGEDDYEEVVSDEYGCVYLVATFYRNRTAQEIERKIEDDYYEEIKKEKQERETYEILKKKFEEKEK